MILADAPHETLSDSQVIRRKLSDVGIESRQKCAGVISDAADPGRIF